MDIKTAIVALSQSEKIKSGIIWASQLADLLGATQNEKAGAKETVRTLIAMIGHESILTRRTTRDDAWISIEKELDMALAMIDSGVPREAIYRLSRALSQVVGISGKAMSFLIEKGLL